MKFHLSSGIMVEAIIESDGLSIAQVRTEVEETINEDGIYTLLNAINEEWIVLQGKRIDAFGITDLGEQGLKLAEEGFIFK